MESTRNIAPVKLALLMAIVHNNKSAYYASVIQSHKANLQLTLQMLMELDSYLSYRYQV